MEDVHEMKRSSVEDFTLVWVDSSRREDGGTSSNYSVKLVEPLRNVVGIRVLEATIPATVMSVEDYNDKLVIQSVAYPDACPVSPASLLAAHTEGPEGAAWRVHTSANKTTIYDPGHDAEHSFQSADVPVYTCPQGTTLSPQKPQSAIDEVALCAFPGNRVNEFNASGAANVSASAYDPISQSTLVVCVPDARMDTAGTVELTTGVFQLPHGKYDGLQDFLSELRHEYDSERRGVLLDFIEAMTYKADRSLRLRINPVRVWKRVESDQDRFAHTYPSGQRWCALWTGSSALSTIGFHANLATLRTLGGSFIVSDPDIRYGNKIRGNSLVNLASERYVWLRCPEVEKHMCAGVGKVLQQGIGVFRLNTPGVFKEERTEFVSTIPRQFHPISKLSQLSFRFDMGSRENTPYDFRNVSHYMLISVSTLKPDNQALYGTIPRNLNPSYVPNALTYQMQEHDKKHPQGTGSVLTPAQERQVVDIHNAAISESALPRWHRF